MEFYISTSDAYHFNMDHNGFPALTRDNVRRIDFLIEHDSKYNFNRIKELIQRHKKTQINNEILEIVKLIDVQNSTHQASQGKNGGNGGREKTADAICKIDDFYTRLEKGDPKLVNEIAKEAIEGRYTFSFASKYCTYVARYTFDGAAADNYSIYDKIICNILPYYAWYYTGTGEYNKKDSIAKKFGKKDHGDYEGYRDLIDKIRDASKKRTDYHISREDFDHLLWYYFKGHPEEVTKAWNLMKPEKQ